MSRLADLLARIDFDRFVEALHAIPQTRLVDEHKSFAVVSERVGRILLDDLVQDAMSFFRLSQVVEARSAQDFVLRIALDALR